LQPGLLLPVSQPWWQVSSVIEVGSIAAFHSEAEAPDAQEQSLSLAVAEQAIAYVPLGAFLSGGIDSYLIAALLQRQSSHPLRTFTVGFEEAGFNEAPYARAVASKEFIAAITVEGRHEAGLPSCTAHKLGGQLRGIAKRFAIELGQLWDQTARIGSSEQGFAVASSQVPGYNRYFWGPYIWNCLAWLPSTLLRGLGRAIISLPPPDWDFLGQPLPVRQIDHKDHKIAARLRHVRSSNDLHRTLVSEWRDRAVLMQGEPIELPSTALDQPLPACLSSDPVSRMTAWDALSYLPDDILVKVERAAMAVGLETSAPFLYHRVARVDWRLPMAMKIRGNTSKWALRQIFYQYVPQELIDRPKAGFAIPMGQWLRAPLRSWASELLHPDRLAREGYLRPEPITRLWHQHLSGSYDHTTKLWSVLMWQAWLEEWC